MGPLLPFLFPSTVSGCRQTAHSLTLSLVFSLPIVKYSCSCHHLTWQSSFTGFLPSTLRMCLQGNPHLAGNWHEQMMRLSAFFLLTKFTVLVRSHLGETQCFRLSFFSSQASLHAALSPVSPSLSISFTRHSVSDTGRSGPTAKPNAAQRCQTFRGRKRWDAVVNCQSTCSRAG